MVYPEQINLFLNRILEEVMSKKPLFTNIDAMCLKETLLFV